MHAVIPMFLTVLGATLCVCSVHAVEERVAEEIHGPYTLEDVFGPQDESQPAASDAERPQQPVPSAVEPTDETSAAATGAGESEEETVTYQGARWFSAPGRVFPLVITGRDRSHRIKGVPNRFVVYQYNAYGELMRYFVLEGIDPRLIREIRPNEYELIYVSFRRFVPLRKPDGTLEVFPLIRLAGKSTVFGVGGEAMYFK